jgi:hypothetical protein
VRSRAFQSHLSIMLIEGICPSNEFRRSDGPTAHLGQWSLDKKGLILEEFPSSGCEILYAIHNFLAAALGMPSTAALAQAAICGTKDLPPICSIKDGYDPRPSANYKSRFVRKWCAPHLTGHLAGGFKH